MTCKDVLNTVIENGRVDSDGQGNFIHESLVEEVEFEASENGLDAGECVEFALAHTSHTEPA